MNTVASIVLSALVLGAGVSAAQTPTPDTTKKVMQQSMQAPTQTPSYRRNVPDSLVAQAKITEDSARTLAMSKVPNGVIQTLTLERRRGKLVWSFAIRDPAKSGNTQVLIDALDGSIMSGNQKSSS
ncbi:MAG TPA: PepSY domain-containing protein [Gemmatimonadales bacterium]|nr:PepSY domain-containing protein [Gemmatimonadales bacterium]